MGLEWAKLIQMPLGNTSQSAVFFCNCASVFFYKYKPGIPPPLSLPSQSATIHAQQSCLGKKCGLCALFPSANTRVLTESATLQMLQHDMSI